MSADCPVYRAERAAARKHPAFDAVVPAPQAFVDFVCHGADPLFRQLRKRAGTLDNTVAGTFAMAHVTVATAPLSSNLGLANIREQHIDLAPGLPTQHTLIHEIAHLCSPVDAAHDVRFAANLLALVKRWLGERPAVVLLEELRKQGVNL